MLRSLLLRPARRAVMAVMLLGAPAAALAEEPEISEEERRAIEESLRTDEEAQASQPSAAPQVSRAPAAGAGSVSGLDLSLVLDVAGAIFSERDSLQMGGHDPSETGFNLQQLELAIGSNIDPYLRFDANLVFSLFGVEIEEAVATTLALPWSLQARAGQFLTRFGRINTMHPHAWSFADQPLVSGKLFGSEGSRGLGAELSWLSPLPWYAELMLSAGDAAGECCARSFFGAEDLGVRAVDDLLYTAALKQCFPFGADWSLAWGLSGQFGPNATGNANRTAIYGTDLYLRYRPVGSTSRTAVSLTVEAMLRSRQVPDDVLQDGGGYAQLVWNIDPRWEAGVRWELVTGVADDPLDPDWTEQRTRTSAQVTFYPSHFSRLRLQGSLDRPEWLDEPIWAAFLALEIIAGAHGAHAF